MKYWIWICLELLIVFGIGAWIYFLSEDALAKGLVGFGILYLVEECKEINRRKTMDYKEGMTCGECLKYVFCPVANHNTNHKACMKITTKENYTIEQNAGENQIKGGVVSISGSVEKHYRPFNDCDELIETLNKIYKEKTSFEMVEIKLIKPLIWVKSKEHGTEELITAFDNTDTVYGSCVFLQDVWRDMKELFEKYTFLDGSPCGVQEVE